LARLRSNVQFYRSKILVSDRGVIGRLTFLSVAPMIAAGPYKRPI